MPVAGQLVAKHLALQSTSLQSDRFSLFILILSPDRCCRLHLAISTQLVAEMRNADYYLEEQPCVATSTKVE
jgi:hypothetical protein